MKRVKTAQCHTSKIFITLMSVMSVVFFLPHFTEAATTTPYYIDSWQKGASIYFFTESDYSSDSYKQTVKDLKAIGANYVSIVIPYHQTTKNSSIIFSGNDTPSDTALIFAINYAHSVGLHVMLKPHLAPDDTDWRAYIDATDRNAWFDSYGKMLNHLGDIGTATGVEEICMGTELIGMSATTSNPTNTAHWITMIQNLRTHYSGLLTYSANWGGGDFGDEVSHIEFWPYLDTIGISAYFKLADDSWNASTSEILDAWKYWDDTKIRVLSETYGKKILFTEVGYRSIDGGNTDPWNGGRKANVNLDIQARLYDTLMQYWSSKSYMIGFHMWNWELDPNEGGIGNTHYTIQHKPAEQVLKTWFTEKDQKSLTNSLALIFKKNSSPSQEIGTSTIVFLSTTTPQSPGVQTFNIALQDRPVYTYVTYWSLDGSEPQEIPNALNGDPYKQLSLETSSWTWHGKGPYFITFTSREFSGKIIAQKSIPIFVGK